MGSNRAKYKGFALVLQCRNVAPSAVMTTPAELTVCSTPTPRGAVAGPAPDLPNRPPGVAPDGVPDGAPDGELRASPATPAPREIGGREGPDPTRYGDWEKNGRCIDF